MSGFDFSFRQLAHMARLLVPYMLLALLMMTSLVALPLPVIGFVKPYLVLMAVYYWAIYRPTLVPPALCFALGLTIDALSGMPLGLNALILVLVRWMVSDQRRFLMGQPFVSIWAVFCLVAVLATLLQWGLYGLNLGEWAPLWPVFGTVILSVFLFPFVSLLLIMTHRLLPVASRGQKR